MRRDVRGSLFRAVLAGVLVLAVFVVGHNLYFLLKDGSGYASDIARTGDGSSWDAAVRLVLAAAALLGIVAGVRLVFLFSQLRGRPHGQRIAGFPFAGYLHMVGRFWLTLFAGSAALFVLQENYERLSAGLPMPGLAVIGTVGLGSPILVFALVSLAVAFVVALYRLGVDRLEALIAEASARTWRRTPQRRLPGWSDPESAPKSVIAHNLAGRAPPAPVRA
jgi:hypothetical protein